MTGAQWIVKSLKQHGVKTVFGYPGGQIMPLYDALYDGGLQHVLCRHEQGAVMAAIGYARSTGKTGVCIATSGPGATNLLTGLADALVDSVPIVAITGQVPRALIGSDAFQEVDILGMSFACTKHSFLVDDEAMLPQIIEQAFEIASAGRPGPVLIDIPKDIQLAKADYQKLTTGAFRICSEQRPSNDPSSATTDSSTQSSCCQNNHLNRHLTLNTQTHSNSPLSTTLAHSIALAQQMISHATKPILYVGGGVTMSGAMAELKHFMQQTQIPSVATLKGLGTLDIDNDYYLGMIGMHGFKPANLAVQSCDLLIALGVRFDDRVTGNLNEFARHAKIIHIDVDPAELGKLKQPHLAIEADIKTVLPYLVKLPDSESLNIESWQRQILQLKEEYSPRYDHPGSGIYAPLLLKLLSDHLLSHQPEKTVVTTDVGQHQMWTAQHMRFTHPHSFISSSGLGTMGFGLPAAVGAQIARPEDTVICVSGDGSFMMNVQELATVKRKQLPIKIVLIDNERLGMVRQWQQLFFDERYSETNLSDNPNFLVLASAFDIPGVRITKKEEVASGLAQMLASEGPFLLHAVIDEMENVWPLVPPGAANDNMLDSVQREEKNF